MRVSVDLTPAQARALDSLSKRQKRSRAAVAREAIDTLLAAHRWDGMEQAFGLWGKTGVDGLAYQEWARGEW